MKKIVGITLAAILALGAAGCAGSGDKDAAMNVEMMVCNDSKNNDQANYMMVKLFKEKFNINLTLTQNSINGHLEKLKLLAASNELPDIISPLPEAEAKNYGSKGALVAVDEYIDQMPNLKKYIDGDKVVYTSMLANDGHLYSIPKINLIPEYKWISMIRTDLVKEVGKEIPTTMAELIDVLTAIKEKHPEIDGVVSRDKMNFLQSYGIMYNTSIGMYYNEELDKWEYGPLNNGYRELVRDFNTMNERGILDKEFFTASLEKWEEKMVNGSGIFTVDWGSRASMANQNHATVNPEDTTFKWELIMPLTSENNTERRLNCSQKIGTWSAFGVSSKVENAEKLLSAIDYLYTDEGAAYLQWGEKDVDYTEENGKKKFLPHIKATYNPEGTEVVAETQGINSPHFMRLTQDDGVSTLPEDLVTFMQDIENSDVETFETNYKIQLTFNEEEEDRIRVITTNLDTFVSENTINLIIGEKPISEYDAFVEQMKKEGAAELESIYAAAYERYLELAKGIE